MGAAAASFSPVHHPRVIGTLALLALSGLVAAGCGSSSPPLSASAITRALPRVLAGRSVELVEVTKAGRDSDTLTMNLSPNDASMKLVEGSAEFDLVRASGVIYLRSNSAGVLEDQLGLGNNIAAETLGKWVSIPPSDGPYHRLGSFFSLGDEVGLFTPGQPGLRLGPQVTVRSIPTLPVEGTPPSQTLEGGTGSVTLFVSPAAPHLPVGATLEMKNGSQHELVAAAFTRWGERVRVPAPATSIPFVSIANA